MTEWISGSISSHLAEHAEGVHVPQLLRSLFVSIMSFIINDYFPVCATMSRFIDPMIGNIFSLCKKIR